MNQSVNFPDREYEAVENREDFYDPEDDTVESAEPTTSTTTMTTSATNTSALDAAALLWQSGCRYFRQSRKG
jgi:hypothetical protein